MAVKFGKFVVVWKSIGPEKENRLLMAFDTTIECNAFIYGIISTISWFGGPDFPGFEAMRREFVIRDVSRVDKNVLAELKQIHKEFIRKKPEPKKDNKK